MAFPSVLPDAALPPLTSLVTTADPAGLLPARGQMALSLGWHIVLACFGKAQWFLVCVALGTPIFMMLVRWGAGRRRAK